MECPKCQHEIPEDSRFCKECGNQLSSSSTPSPQTLSFDEKIDQIQRYLPKGLTEKVIAQRGKIGGERKQVTVVTVMFCDMEGFTLLNRPYKVTLYLPIHQLGDLRIPRHSQ